MLAESLHHLSLEYPNKQIVLEVHEAVVTNPSEMQALQTELDDLGILLAYDDFGAGQARLLELMDVPPEYLKFDMSLIQGIHLAPTTRQKMLESLVKMVSAIGIKPLAEGVETREEHQMCLDFGFTYAQGYFYGRPADANHL